jgi:cell division protease FtsH
MVQLAAPENPFLGVSLGYDGGRSFSEQTAQTVDAEVHQIVKESQEEARRLLSEHRRELDALAEALLARETLDEQEILRVTGLPPAPALATIKRPVDPGSPECGADRPAPGAQKLHPAGRS